MKSEYPSPAFVVTVLVLSVCANNRRNVSVTLHGGTFVELLLPWRQTYSCHALLLLLHHKCRCQQYEALRRSCNGPFILLSISTRLAGPAIKLHGNPFIGSRADA
jgi:hypothetical protein